MQVRPSHELAGLQHEHGLQPSPAKLLARVSVDRFPIAETGQVRVHSGKTLRRSGTVVSLSSSPGPLSPAFLCTARQTASTSNAVPRMQPHPDIPVARSNFRGRESSPRATSSSNSDDPPLATWTEDEPILDGDDFYDDWDDETFSNQAPPQRTGSTLGITELDLNRWRLKPVEEKYRIQVERSIPQERLQELGISGWSTWSSPGPCAYVWEWKADEQVYITRGTLRITPYGCDTSAELKAGDLVRFPKWLLAELELGGNYEQKYRFRAYGDDN